MDQTSGGWPADCFTAATEPSREKDAEGTQGSELVPHDSSAASVFCLPGSFDPRDTMCAILNVSAPTEVTAIICASCELPSAFATYLMSCGNAQLRDDG